MKKQSVTYLATLGIILYLLGGIANVFSVIGTMQSFNALEEGGAPNAVAMAEGIELSFMSALWSGLGITLGVILSIIAISNGFKEKWFWKALFLSSFLVILNVPFGTLVGIGFLIYLLRNKESFFSSEEIN